MLGQVEEVGLSGELLDLYSDCYFKRYKVRPILSKNGSDQTLAKDLIRNHGYATARDFIEAFLQSEAWVFTQKKHPLSALQKDINIVNTDLATLRRRKGSQREGLGLRVRVLRACDRPLCTEHSVDWEGLPEDLILPVYCKACTLDPNRPLELRKSIALASAAEMHKGDSNDRMGRLRIS